MQSTPTHCGSHRSLLALASLASTLLSLTAVAQNAPHVQPSADWTRMPAAMKAAVDSASDEVLFDKASDGALWARGTAYKARFAGEGATIVPFFGSDAPHNYPLELRASAATLGATALDVSKCGRTSRAGDVVRIDRGAFVEEYDLTTKTLEQRFVFDELRGAGDLVLRMDVASELSGSDLGDSLRFQNERGSIDYGAAFAIDASGARIAIDSTLVDGVIELRVPASFVARAELPLVIDPLITAYTAGSTWLDDFLPDVAFDVSTDRWCIVWAAAWSVTDHDAYARLATGSYTLLPGLISLDFTNDAWTTPKIANNNATDSFLVSFTFVPATPGAAEIRGRFVYPASATTSAPLPISPQDGLFRSNNDIGGDPVTSRPSFFCVVWQRPISATNIDIEGCVVSPTGVTGPIIPLENGSGLNERPSISNSIGDDNGDGSIAWNVTWQYEFAPFDHDIFGAQVYWGGSIIHSMFPIDTSGWDDTNPVASTMLDPNGGAPRSYMVAFERDYGDHDVIGAILQGSTVLAEEDLVGDFAASTWYHEQVEPTIDSDGSQFLLAFTERDTPSTYDSNVFVGDYFWDGSSIGACEVHQGLAGTPSAESDASIYSQASSGGSHRDYLATWTYQSANNGYDVVGGLWRGCGSMVESVCDADGSGAACPCGNDGADGHGCANSANAAGGLLGFAGIASVSSDSAQFHASFLPPNAPCLFFEGTSLSAGSPFGNGLRCVTGSTLRLRLKGCDSSGNATYPQLGDGHISVAGNVPAIGGTYYYQAWYRDPAAACSGKFNLTNALRVIWTP